MADEFTIVFIINSKTEEKILTQNPCLKFFKDIYFIYSFKPMYPVFKRNNFQTDTPADLKIIATQLKLKNLIFLYPEEVLPENFKISGENICIETITDKNIRQNNPIHYEHRVFNYDSSYSEVTETPILSYYYFFPDLITERIKLHKGRLHENVCSCLFLARHNYPEATPELLKNFFNRPLSREGFLALKIELAKKLLIAGRLDEAEEILLGTISENFPLTDFLLAKVYFKKFAYDKAGKYFEKCLTSEKTVYFYPVKPAVTGYLAYYSLGLVFLNMGNFSEALNFFQKALEKENKFLPARLAREAVKAKLSVAEKPKFTLSVCMIVKNEEAFIEKAINSVIDIADEIIVLDTGSTDRTKDITGTFAEACHGMNLKVKLYETAWKKDFSASRNESLNYATSDWILYIDGDEALKAEHLQKLSQLLNDPSKLAYLLPVKSYFENGEETFSRTFYNYRLFRNFPEIRFSGVLHEQLIESLNTAAAKTGLSFAEAEVEIEHFGYTLAGKQKDQKNNSRELETELIEKELRSNSLSHSKRIYFLTKAGLLLLLDSKKEDAFNKLNEAYMIAESLEPEKRAMTPSISNLYTGLYEYYFALPDYEQAEKILKEGIENFPGNISLLNFLADFYYNQGKFVFALNILEEMEKLINSNSYYKLSAFNDSLLTWETAFKLAKVYVALNKKEKAEAYFAKTLVNNPPAFIIKEIELFNY